MDPDPDPDPGGQLITDPNPDRDPPWNCYGHCQKYVVILVVNH